MSDLSLRYLLFGEDRTASKAIKGVGAQATSTAGMVSGGLGKMGSMVGGEVGEMLNRVSEGFDHVGTKAKGMGEKLVIGGSAVMGLGLAMQMMASKDVEAQNQLTAAVAATGKGYEGFGEDVEALIAKQVKFGHADDEVKTALRTLTTAYNDPKKALGEMSLVTDLAAAKHISLADAATTVAKAHGGAGKIFKEFGVTVGLNADGTKNYDGALTKLSGKLAGQASASMDTFGGKVSQVKTWLENQASTISEKYGPAVTIAGGVVTAFGSVMQVMATRAAAAAAATDAAGTSTSRLSKVSSMAGGSMSMLAGPLVIGAVALGYFAKQSADSAARVTELSATLDQQTGKVTENTRAFVVKTLSEAGALTSAHDMGVSVNDVTDAVMGNTDALARVNAGLAAYEKAGAAAGDQQSANSDEADKLRRAIGGTNTELTKGIEKAKLQAAATKEGGGASGDAAVTVKQLADAQKNLQDKTKAATDAINTYHQSLQDAGLAVLSTRDAQRNLIQAQVDSAALVAKNGRGLDINTAKGRENATQLDAMATKAGSLGKAVWDETKSEDKMRASLSSSRDALVKTAIKFGMTKDQANAYADKVLKIPDRKQTAVALAGVAKAKADAAAIKTALDKLKPKSVDVAVNMRFTSVADNLTQAMSHNLGSHSVRAAGGPVTAGVPYIVGEHRPEVFVPDVNGTILPRVGVPGAGGGSAGSGSSQPLVVQFMLDGRVLHQSLLALKRTTGGGLGLETAR